MITRREEAESVVWRKTASDLRVWSVITNLFEIVKNPCKSCRTVKPLSSFYLRSASMRKHDNDVEAICVSCWDKQVKKRKAA